MTDLRDQVIAELKQQTFAKSTPEVDSAISDAKARIKALQSSGARRGPAYDGPNGKWDSVYTDPLTPELISAAYTIVTEAGKSFPSDSPAGREFRAKADRVFAKLQRRPGGLVKRSFGQTGTLSYMVIDLGPHTTVQEAENGGLAVEGPNTVRLGGDEDYSPLFDAVAKTEAK
jgi:hypothetical protein